MNKLSASERARILHLLCEGISVTSVSRAATSARTRFCAS